MLAKKLKKSKATLVEGNETRIEDNNLKEARDLLDNIDKTQLEENQLQSRIASSYFQDKKQIRIANFDIEKATLFDIKTKRVIREAEERN